MGKKKREKAEFLARDSYSSWQLELPHAWIVQYWISVMSAWRILWGIGSARDIIQDFGDSLWTAQVYRQSHSNQSQTWRWNKVGGEGRDAFLFMLP